MSFAGTAERSPPLRRAGTLAFAICTLYVLALAYPVHLHIVGVFTDFYRFYAPDADRLALGEFPQNTNNPPGYPVLLFLASPLTGDRFTSGKWMSLLAAGLTGVLAFYLHRRLFGAAAALLAVPIILLSEAFTGYSISAMTEIPFLSVCLGAMLAITDERRGGWQSAVLSGVLCGVAYLIRYNGVFLLVPGLLGVIWREGAAPSRAKLAAAYLGSFLLTVAPWGWLNYTQHGSPFYSTNYVDIVRALALTGEGRELTSLTDAVLNDPGRFARNYVRHAGLVLYNTFGASLAVLPVGPLAALGIILSLARHRRRPVLLVLIGALSFLLLMSLTHWDRRYYFFLLVCYSGFAAFTIFKVAQRIGRALNSPLAERLAVVTLALWILIPSVGLTWQRVHTTLGRQPIELLPAARYLDGLAPRGATVMAVRPHIAYLSHRQWREFPPGAGSVDELKAMLRGRPPDYLVYDRWGRQIYKQLMALAKPDGTFPWLRPIYNDQTGGVVIYAVQPDRR